MMEKPLKIEILTHAPTEYRHCPHCETVWDQAGVGKKYHGDQIASGLPEEMYNDYAALSDWVMKLSRTYCDRIVIRIINVATIEGMAKSLWHRARRYPAVIVGGKEKFTGGDFSAADSFIAGRLGNNSSLI